MNTPPAFHTLQNIHTCAFIIRGANELRVIVSALTSSILPKLAQLASHGSSLTR